MPRVNGRRGAFLVLFAVAYACIGFSYAVAPSSPSRIAALQWLTTHVEVELLGLPWLIAAVLSARAAFLAPPHDRLGFVALFVAPSLWGVLYAVSWLVGDSVSGWVSAILYETIATAVLVVAGMLNPAPREAPR